MWQKAGAARVNFIHQLRCSSYFRKQILHIHCLHWSHTEEVGIIPTHRSIYTLLYTVFSLAVQDNKSKAVKDAGKQLFQTKLQAYHQNGRFKKNFKKNKNQKKLPPASVLNILSNMFQFNTLKNQCPLRIQIVAIKSKDLQETRHKENREGAMLMRKVFLPSLDSVQLATKKKNLCRGEGGRERERFHSPAF